MIWGYWMHIAIGVLLAEGFDKPIMATTYIAAVALMRTYEKSE